MKKFLLALTILAAGAGGFLTARQSTTQLQHHANATREAWLAQTQLVAAVQKDHTGLTEHIRELKRILAQQPSVAESALWSALQTNRADRLPPDLWERLLEELGFNWRSFGDFVVVSKQTVRDLVTGGWTIRNRQLTHAVATVLAVTTEERGQVEAAMQRGQEEFKDWALTHVERIEPQDDVVAHYSLPIDPALWRSISNNFATEVFAALGRERAELILRSTKGWMSSDLGVGSPGRSVTATMIIKREVDGNEEILKVEGKDNNGKLSGPLREDRFPPAFRPLFPNGWADVAKREGFELPEDSQQQQLQSAPQRSDEKENFGIQPNAPANVKLITK